jgi:tetratricopeptide (TPR) repeat protein
VRAPLALIVTLALTLYVLPPAARAQTTEADVFVAQAVVDFDEKQYESALANLRRALELEPDHVEALYYMGVVNMALRRPADAIPFLVRARQKAPSDPAINSQLGLAYVAQQQYEQAQPILESVFRSQPTLDGLGYYVGFMRYRKKDYRGALEAFRAGRTTDTDLEQLTRFYSGLALAALGLPAQAAAEVEQALRTAPSSALTAPAERLRDTIVAARSREHRLSAELRLGVFFDDNVAIIPDAAPIDPGVQSIRGAKHESTGELLGLRVEYSWLKDLLKRDDWDGTIGYSFFGTYVNDLPKFNVADHMLTAGVTHRMAVGAMALQLGLQYAWDVMFLQADSERVARERLRDVFLSRQTVTPFAALVENDMHLTQVFGRYQGKWFDREPGTPATQVLDADNWMVGFLHLVRFQADQHFVKLGYQFDYEDAWGNDFQYRGHRLLAGAQYTLPWKAIRLKYDIEAHLRDYLHVNSLLLVSSPATKRRQDEEILNTVRAEIPFLNTCVRKDDCIAWTLAAEYQRTDAHSNIALFDYTRNVFSLILSLTY